MQQSTTPLQAQPVRVRIRNLERDKPSKQYIRGVFKVITN